MVGGLWIFACPASAAQPASCAVFSSNTSQLKPWFQAAAAARLTQLVECQPLKLKVRSSNLLPGFFLPGVPGWTLATSQRQEQQQQQQQQQQWHRLTPTLRDPRLASKKTSSQGTGCTIS
jgi:hypothetical protein